MHIQKTKLLIRAIHRATDGALKAINDEEQRTAAKEYKKLISVAKEKGE